MFCKNCGNHIADGMAFCTSCGAPVEANNANPNPNAYPNPNVNVYANVAEVKKSGNKTATIAIGAAVIIIGVIAIIVGANSGKKRDKDKEDSIPKYEQPVQLYFEALQNCDGKAMEKAFPDYLIEYYEEDLLYWYDDEYESVADYFEDMLKDSLDDLEYDYGENIKISYEVTDKTQLDESDLKKVENDALDYYDKEIDVQMGYNLELTMKIRGSEDSDEDEGEIKVYKIDGKWCITSLSF